jgi:hypothetical protein
MSTSWKVSAGIALTGVLVASGLGVGPVTDAEAAPTR